MMQRVKLVGDTTGEYFSTSNPLEFINSGSGLLDCVLGGGWPLGRISNVVGDFSTGKTLLAIEACANFIRKFPNGKVWYRESEAAFDKNYAANLGMPVDKVSFVDDDLEFLTIEDFYEDLSTQLDAAGKDCPGLYILDSLDALSDKGELDRKFDEGSYSMQKAKYMHKIMRMCTKKIAKTNTHLMVISQEKDKIGVMFGKKTTRSGGRALDFFSSQVLWLSHLGTTTREINKIKRPVGIEVKAKCEKNKIGLALRQCDFLIMFSHGMDSLASNIHWLESINRLEEVTGFKTKLAYSKKLLDGLSDEAYWQESKRVDGEVTRIWKEVEDSFTENVRKKNFIT